MTRQPAGTLRRVLWAAAALVAALAIWAAISAALGAHSLAQARTEAARAQDRIVAGDAAGAGESLRSLAGHSRSVGRWLGGAPWTWAGSLPGVGPTAMAMTVMADAAASVVPPLAESSAAVLGGSDGDLTAAAAALGGQREALAATARAAVAAGDAVAAVDPDGLLGPARKPFIAAQRQFAGSVEAATGLAAASVLLPGLLGTEAPAQWLLVAAQPAEARGSGAGFFGAYGVLEGEAGRLRVVDSRPNDEVFDQPADLSVLPPEFAALWGESAAYIWGHNLTRHFPYAATLLQQTVGRTGVDPQYIVAIDPRIVAALLELTGPVTAAGVTIDAAGAEGYLTSGIYRQFPDGPTKNAVALDLMSAVLLAVQARGPSAAELASALAEPLAQQRLVAWAADPGEQEIVAMSSVAGGLPRSPEVLTAAINNAAGNKLDAYLRSAVEVVYSGPCGGDPGTGTVSVTLDLADVPDGLTDYVAAGLQGPGRGGTRLMVHVYGPPGAALSEVTVDGATALVSAGTERGRPVWGTTLDLVAGVPRTVSVVFNGLPAGGGPPQFLPQPMIQDTGVSLRDDRVC